MSGGASDIPTDEDCEVPPDNGFSYSDDFSKKTPKKKLGKPPPSLRSPYLSSMNVHARKAAMSAWKLPWTSLCDTPGGETHSTRFTSLSNHRDRRSEWDMTPDFPRHTLPSRKHHHSAPNVARDKEEMHHEITLLKKSLNEQKSDNQKMKVKLRRLEDDNAKREKQLEEFLDPTNRSEYIRSLVDKKPEGSVVVNGLKQRILKLEQQCREKENVISHLQSELRTTNLQEMKMTVKKYFEEIQRLKLLLEASEKSGIAESKVFRRQQKALSSTVLRLSEDLKQLQLDNATLREELDTDSPAAGIKGYKEWSKYRLLRRLLELEKRLEERLPLKARNQLDRECQTAPVHLVHQETQTAPAKLSNLAVQTEREDVTTQTTKEKEVSDLRGRVERLEAERTQLQQALASKQEDWRQTRRRQQDAEEETRRHGDDEARELRAEKEELEKRLERWRAEQTSERELERRRHREEVQLLTRKREQEDERWRGQLESERRQQEYVNTLFDLAKAEAKQSWPGRLALASIFVRQELEQLRKLVEILKEKGNQSRDESRASAHRDETDKDDDECEEEEEGHDHGEPDTETRASGGNNKSEAGDSTIPPGGGLLDDESLVSIQAAFRGHLTRTQHLTHSLPKGAPSQLTFHTNATVAKRSLDKEAPWLASRTHKPLTPPKDAAQSEGDAGDDAYSENLDNSDDSDDIIVAESYPRRNREARIL
ncbi:IQ domain-containing protein E isoform X2 [Syngnathus acus]|uniref:IQ domain-containing protein E isoform X2 n=1 Tax=Syngnathus acus TaxID=161584 RepID=UPI001886414E|nr:IQ domain-containing protein E isoform X2 [Syngnathus acus]